MARTTRLIPASPERIFEVLSDPASYGYWVVGSDTIRDADGAWPAKGSRFHHRVGVGPIKVNDNTEVLTVEAPRLLRLHARARPLFGTALVELMLERRGGGTLVTMDETAGDVLSRVAINPLTDPLVKRRNDVSLRRLEELALGTKTAEPVG